MQEIQKLKRAVIKEEYVAITGDYIKAIILNQFIYWSERVQDFDEFIEEENKRAKNHDMPTYDLLNGWIYKTAEELSCETMLNLTKTGMRNHIKALINQGFISERTNPKYKWDRTKQYRVNLQTIAQALQEKGYNLEGYALIFPIKSQVQILDMEVQKNKLASPKNGLQNPKFGQQYQRLHTEITIDKESKKERECYNSILSKIEDEELKELYIEYIKMRKLIKSQLTNKSLKMLIDKVNQLEPVDIERQKQLLRTAIMNGWKDVYPIQSKDIKEKPTKSYGSRPSEPCIPSCDPSYDLSEYENSSIFD